MKFWIMPVLALSACLWPSKSPGDDKWLDRATRQAALAKNITSVSVVADMVTLRSNELSRVSFADLREHLATVGETRRLEKSMLAPLMAAEPRTGNRSGATIRRLHSYWSSGDVRLQHKVNGFSTRYHGDDVIELRATPLDESNTMFTFRRRDSAQLPHLILAPQDVELSGLSENYLKTLASPDPRISLVEDRVVIVEASDDGNYARATIDAATGFLLDSEIGGRILEIQQNPVQLAGGLFFPGRRVVAIASADEPDVIHTLIWRETHDASVNDDIPDALSLSAVPGDRVHIDKSISYFAARRTQVLKQEIPDLLAWVQERQRRF